MRESGYHFWLRYAAREGALIEDAGASALLVLPQPLQARFDLPEQITVTTDPDAAREDGALLLIPGHPLLDAAASHVLTEGDAGVVRLAWPLKPSPSTSTLVAAAREQVGVEHGRIDADGEAVPRYAPVLRVSAQVTYVVNEHFHEREEVWVDARSMLPLDRELEHRIQELPRLEGRPEHAGLEPDLLLALKTVDGLLRERAAVRLRALATQSEAALRDELALAESYYSGVLESIAERQRGAPPERQAFFDAQTQTTRAERKRRLHEIEEKFQARHEIHPIRLHMILLPTLQLPVVIRRGARSYGSTLTWWLATSRFAEVRCPFCQKQARLVAGRERLGCQLCLKSRVMEAIEPAPNRSAARMREVAIVSGQSPAPKKSSPANRGREHPNNQVPQSWPAHAARAADQAQRLRESVELQKRVIRIGNKLGGDFWQAMVDQESWPRKRADPYSPLRVLYRLYGAEGPLRGVGIPAGAVPIESTFFTEEQETGFLNRTSGWVFAAGRSYFFTLRWHLAAGKPVVDEVLPFQAAFNGRFFPSWGLVADVLYDNAPAPRIELDPVSANLWRIELGESGLPLVVRCLAAWWRIGDYPDLATASPAVVSAALAVLVARRAGVDRTPKRTALDYGVDPAVVASAGRRLQRLLGLSDLQNW